MSLRTLYRLIFGGSNIRQRFWEKWLTYILAFTIFYSVNRNKTMLYEMFNSEFF